MYKDDSCYVVEYEDHVGNKKILKDKIYGGYKEFNTFESAHRLKVWFDKKGYQAQVKSLRL